MRNFILTIAFASGFALLASGGLCSSLLAMHRQQQYQRHLLPLVQAAGLLHPACR